MNTAKTKSKFTNLYDLREYFRDEETCRKYLEKYRWPDGKPVCPICGCENVYRLKGGRIYKCANNKCYKKFTVTIGTIFENTKIPLSKWFIAMYIITAHTKGISSVQLSKDIGVTQKTAWFINHRIREMLRDKDPQVLSNMVEIDETFVGGKEYNKHNSKKVRGDKGWPIHKKTVMLGLLERGNKVIAFKVKDTKRASLIPIINKTVKENSIVITDELSSYKSLYKHFHFSVNHMVDEYSVGKVIHVNTIEGFWSILKRGIIGIYHFVSEKHVERYLTEFTARYNNRNISEIERFNNFLSQCNGRLKYTQLIA